MVYSQETLEIWGCFTTPEPLSGYSFVGGEKKLYGMPALNVTASLIAERV